MTQLSAAKAEVTPAHKAIQISSFFTCEAQGDWVATALSAPAAIVHAQITVFKLDSKQAMSNLLLPVDRVPQKIEESWRA